MRKQEKEKELCGKLMVAILFLIGHDLKQIFSLVVKMVWFGFMLLIAILFLIGCYLLQKFSLVGELVWFGFLENNNNTSV